LFAGSLAAGSEIDRQFAGGSGDAFLRVSVVVGCILSLHPHMAAYLLALRIRQCQIFRKFRSEETKMKLRPLQDRVLIRRVEPETKTAGGIFIPDTAQEKPMEGEVVAVGPGARDEAGKLHPLDVKLGDRVLFGKWSGTEVKLDGEDLMIMKEADIMGVLDHVAAQKKAA
jgi:chaperonin GroES